VSTDDDEQATRRNVIPWRTVEKELAARLAAKAARAAHSTPVPPSSEDREVGSHAAEESEIPPGPDSGVRSSSEGLEGFQGLQLEAPRPLPGHDVVVEAQADTPQRPLTYSMYTIDQIEAREVQAQRLSVVMPQPQVLQWSDVARSGLVLLRTLATWAKSSPRPRAMDVCRVPLTAFSADLRAVLARLPWKKIGLGAAIGLGALVLFLFAIVTVAELTDDLKPTHAAVAPALTAAPPTVAAPLPIAAAAAAEPPAVVELDDAPPTAPATKAAPAPRAPAKPKPAKRAAAVERFIP
jgi:hypothetical protein